MAEPASPRNDFPFFPQQAHRAGALNPVERGREMSEFGPEKGV